MANHVTTFVSFENISDEAREFLKNIDMSQESDKVIMNFVEEEVGDTRQEWVDAFGAKWVLFEDIEEDGAFLTSAWSPPDGLLNKMYEKLQSFNCPNLIMWARYDDEMPNFVGVLGRCGDFFYEEYVESEDFESFMGATPTIDIGDDDWEYNEEWDEKLDKWYDEEYGYFQENYSEYLTQQHLDEKIDRNTE